MEKKDAQGILLSPSIRKDYAGFIDENGGIIPSKTIRELKERYVEICNEYFENIAGHKRELFSVRDMAEIRRRAIELYYDFLSVRGEMEKLSYVPQTYETEDTLKAYKNMLDAIAAFEFKAQGENTYGAKQNEMTKNILTELESLVGPLKMMLANFDSYFSSELSANEEQKKDEETTQLEHIVERLRRVYKSMNFSAERYHEYWTRKNYYRSAGTTYSRLGQLKEDWKRERNSALKEILSFFQEIKVLHDTIVPQEKRVYNENQVKYILDSRVHRIVTGPYYYSFLSKEESTEQAKRNKILKQIERSFDVNDLYIAYVIISDPSKEPGVWEASATQLPPWHAGGYVTVVAKLVDKLVDLKNARIVATKRDVTNKCYFVSNYQEFTDYYKEEESPKDTLSRKEALEKALSYYDKFIDKVAENPVIRL